jgi:glycosyltransferase involved in cell wall biosynthesis
MKILVITSTYPRHAEDYAVPWMRETHKRMKEKGHEVTVLAPAFKGLASHQLNDIEVVRFRYAPKSMETLTHEEGASYKIRKSSRQILAIPYVIVGCLLAFWLALTRKYDAVHVHWPFPHGIMGQVAAFVGQMPLIIMSHGAEFALARKKSWIKPFLRQSLRAADLCIANSSDTASMVEDISSRHCEILPYGSTVTPLKDVPSSRKQQPRVLFTGRLIERKGIDYLLKAAPSVLTKHDAKFIITGDGDQRARLEKVRDELGLQNAVEFVGFLSKKDLSREYQDCDVWVNPGIVDSWGDAEGLGIGSIEAYNYHKPVIASAVDGIPDTVVDGQTGFLVPQKDSKSLANAICDLLDDPEKAKQFGKNGFQFALKKFSWDRIISKLERLYEGVCFPSATSRPTQASMGTRER